MSVSLKHQLKFIVNSLAKKSFGFHRQFPLIKTKLIFSQSSNQYSYQIPIGRQIYDQFQKDGFRWSDHGSTPQSITQQLIVHYKQLKHVCMAVDEWGNIIASINQVFIQDYMTHILSKQQLTFYQCQQFFQWRHKSQFKPKSYTFIDLNLQNIKQKQNLVRGLNVDKDKTTLDEFRQFCFKSCCKNIIEKVIKSNFHNGMFYQKQIQKLIKQHAHTNIIGTCLNHQTIQAEIILSKITKQFKIYKFGSVFPQTKFNANCLDKKNLIKLKLLFLKTDHSKSINFDKLPQFQQQLDIDCKFSNIAELLISGQQMLNDFNLKQIYKIYRQIGTKQKKSPVQSIIQKRMREILQLI